MALKVLTQSLNVGVVDKANLHRTDLERMRLTAEEQTNLVATVPGPASFRAGLEFLDVAADGGAETLLVSFVAGEEDGFLLELTDMSLQVRNPETDELVTRQAVSSTISDPHFATGAGWTLAASGGADCIAAGSLQMRAFAWNSTCSAKQLVTTLSPNVEHALRIDVTRGPVTFRCGSTDAGDEYIAEAQLDAGIHSLAFTPTGSYYLRFSTESKNFRVVASIDIEAAGVMKLPTIWPLAALELFQHDQSLDVMFCAVDGYRQQKIERRGDASWSVCNYQSDLGPFKGKTSDVKMTPGATMYNTNLSTNVPFFKPEHVGALFRLFTQGQAYTEYLAGVGEGTTPIEVNGVNETTYNERSFTLNITGTWVGTLRVQRSFEGPDTGFHDFRRETGFATIDITANATYTNDDNEDNITVWYRVVFAAYTSGFAVIAIDYKGGGGWGVCRMVSYDTTTNCQIENLRPFSKAVEAIDWEEGSWSAKQGYPAATTLADGRLWWFGEDHEWGSVSNAYSNFDIETEGDSAPLLRSIALGGRNKVRWAAAPGTLLVGADGRLLNVRASSIEETLTPDNFNNKSIGKVGSATVAPVELANGSLLFVEKAGSAIYEVSWSNEKGGFLATEFSKLTRALFRGGVRQMAVQSRPDQRIWTVVEDSDAVCIVYDPLDQVIAHIPISTKDRGDMTDVIESVAVLPGLMQDRVYLSIRRTVNGSVLRYIEKQALDSEALVGTITKCVDSFVTFGAGVSSISVPHLAGRTVTAWMDGAPVYVPGTTTPAELQVSLAGLVQFPSTSVEGGVVGLPYVWRYKSPRLAYGVQNGTPMLQNKTLEKIGLMLSDYCRSSIKYGPRFDDPLHPLRSMPAMRGGTEATEVVAGVDGDEAAFPAGSGIALDTRLCIEGRSPAPATVRAIVMGVEGFGS